MPVQVVTAAYGSVDPAVVEVTPQVGDSSTAHAWAIQENDLVFVYNSGTAAVQVTLKSAPDAQNRDVDSVIAALAAGDVAVFGPLKLDAWQQSNGNGEIEVDTSTDPLIVVLRLAGKA